jgi:hypothetical protein
MRNGVNDSTELAAGRRARASVIIRPRVNISPKASPYYKECWQTQYSLTFEFVKEQAEIEDLAGNFIQSEQLLVYC